MADKFIRSANAERTAANGIKNILKKLEAGNYMNAPYEEADRKMLTIYLNRGK